VSAGQDGVAGRGEGELGDEGQRVGRLLLVEPAVDQGLRELLGRGEVRQAGDRGTADAPPLGSVRRLMITIFPADVAMFALWGAIPGILLPLQIEELDPANKAANLALVATVGAFAAMLAQPLAGALSDRTRSRFGPRGPWIVGSAFAEKVGAGYLVFAGTAAVLLTLFVVLNPDRDNRADERRPFDPPALLRTFWFNPRRHPDFGWAFIGRLLLYLGYFMISNYQLYLLQDSVGLGDEAAAFVPIVGVAGLVPILIATALGGPLSDRFGRRKVFIYIAAIICAVSLVIPWMMPTKAGFLIYAVINGFGFGFFQSVDTALVTEVLPAQKDAAKDLGVVNIAATLPQVLAPGVAGAVVVATGYTALFPIAIVLMVLGGFAVAPIKKVR
jgi:MFS family permease